MGQSKSKSWSRVASCRVGSFNCWLAGARENDRWRVDHLSINGLRTIVRSARWLYNLGESVFEGSAVKRVLSKLRELSLPKKILLVVVAALAFGFAAYLFRGGPASIVAGIAGAIAALFGLDGRNQNLANQAAELAARNRKRAEEDAELARTTAESKARERSEVREEEALVAAVDAGSDDAGDPNRVLERHTAGSGPESNDD